MPDQRNTGLYRKFQVSRTDGRDQPGGDRADAQYFVLDYKHDPFARLAVLIYAIACAEEYPYLSYDLLVELQGAADLPTLERMECSFPAIRSLIPSLMPIIDKNSHLYARSCPRCGSTNPKWHPATQHEGEAMICPDPWHTDAQQ